MAILDLGPYTDADNDRGQSTLLHVPDEGELPELHVPNLTWIGTQATYGSTYGLGSHQWVRIDLELHENDNRHHWIGVFFVESRREWVCFLCESYYSPYGYYLGEHRFTGPFQVNRIIMGNVIGLAGLLSLFNETPEMRHCHPDLFESMEAEITRRRNEAQQAWRNSSQQ